MESLLIPKNRIQIDTISPLLSDNKFYNGFYQTSIHEDLQSLLYAFRSLSFAIHVLNQYL